MLTKVTKVSRARDTKRRRFPGRLHGRLVHLGAATKQTRLRGEQRCCTSGMLLTFAKGMA